MMYRETIIKQARLELARRDFFYFCMAKAPTFYRKSSSHTVVTSFYIQGFHGETRADVDRLVLLRWLIGSEIQDG